MLSSRRCCGKINREKKRNEGRSSQRSVNVGPGKEFVVRSYGKRADSDVASKDGDGVLGSRELVHSVSEGHER